LFKVIDISDTGGC